LANCSGSPDRGSTNAGAQAGCRRGGDWRYPRCQFDGEAHEILEGISRVERAHLGDRPSPDGIAYRSRHDPREIRHAIFERPAPTLVAGSPIALLDQPPDLAAILGGYGKSIAEPAL